MDIERSPKLHFSNKKPPLPPPVSLFSHKIKLKVPKESFISANSTDIDTSYVDGGHKFLEKFKRKKESILSLSQQYLEFLEQEEEKEEVSVFHHNFEKVEFLGKGQFCNVYQAVHKLDGKRYAIKVTNHTIKNVKPRGQVKNEAQILAALSVLEEGKNIVRYYNSWMEKKDLYLQVKVKIYSFKYFKLIIIKNFKLNFLKRKSFIRKMGLQKKKGVKNFICEI